MPTVTLQITTITEARVHVTREDRRNYGTPQDFWDTIAIAKYRNEAPPEETLVEVSDIRAVNVESLPPIAPVGGKIDHEALVCCVLQAAKAIDKDPILARHILQKMEGALILLGKA